MTQVHFTFESEEIQAIINESGANDTAKTLMTIMFNQLMEEQRNQYIQANAYERLVLLSLKDISEAKKL